MDGMNIEPATKNPLATEEIGGMIEMIRTLIEKDTRMKRMARSITVQENSKITESFLIKTWMTCSPADGLFW